MPMSRKEKFITNTVVTLVCAATLYSVVNTIAFLIVLAA